VPIQAAVRFFLTGSEKQNDEDRSLKLLDNGCEVIEGDRRFDPNVLSTRLNEDAADVGSSLVREWPALTTVSGTGAINEFPARPIRIPLRNSSSAWRYRYTMTHASNERRPFIKPFVLK